MLYVNIKRAESIAKVISLKTLGEATNSLFDILRDRAEIKSDLIEAIDEEWSAENE